MLTVLLLVVSNTFMTITLVVSSVFAFAYLGETPRANYVVAAVFLLCAVAAAFWPHA